ncbi:MAG TPA: magnesium transporter CorA family protein [Burkholderiaceae bacterium]
MRILEITGRARELDAAPATLPERGFIWISAARRAFEVNQGAIQEALQRLAGTTLLDLHISDLLNNQLPSHYDFTSLYDMVVFRRLAASERETASLVGGVVSNEVPSARTRGPSALRHIDTSPVGFAVFDRVLVTVHPADCTVRDYFVERLLKQSDGSAATGAAGGAPVAGLRKALVRMPTSPAELMLRIIDNMVDGYLELRRRLTTQLDRWQSELLSARARFTNWQALLDGRNTLHQLQEMCEDQRTALAEWLQTLNEDDFNVVDREMLQVRTRDTLEHIERVLSHVQRLEQSLESAIQMHFSATANRTNDVMRVLTALTAIFLPLNLIAGIFGMNFEFIPLIHTQAGFWWACGAMLMIAVGMVGIFWRKRYLARTGR